jgi:protein-glutamine gamma-glutamyltransferase
MTAGRLRPGRLAPAAAGHLLLAVTGVALATGTGAAWLYLAAVLVAVGLVPALLLPASGAARARLRSLDTPAVVVAGDPARLAVSMSVPRAATVEIVDRGAVVGSAGLRRGTHTGFLDAVFATPGTVERLEVRVRCGAPFGWWTWTRTTAVALHPPLLVGPAPVAGEPPRPVVDEREAYQDHEAAGGAVESTGALRGVREWGLGDPIGWVHWPATLRAGELLVRSWDPPARDAVEVTVPPGAGHELLGRAAGAVDAALEAGWDVRLATSGPAGTEVTPVRDRLDAAAVLAPLATPPHEPGPPAARPDGIEHDRAARAAVTATLLVGAGAALAVLGWPPGLTLVTLLGLPAAGWLAWRGRNGRGPLVMLVTAAALLTVVVRFVTAVGDVEAVILGAVRDPLAELLIGGLVVHSVDMPQRRNLRFAIAASGVLLLYAGALRVDPGYAPWLVVWCTAAALALVSLHASEVRDAGHLDEARVARAHRPVRSFSRPALAGVACGAATLLLLTLVPVPEGPVRLLTPSRVPVRSPVPVPGGVASAVGAGGGAGGTGGQSADEAVIEYTAFAEQFDTSARGRPGREVVLRVRAPAPDFWRGQTFERWDGRTWYAASERGTFTTGPVIDVRGLDGGPRISFESDELVQTYYVEKPLPNLVFAASRPERLYLDAGVWVRPDGGLRADTTLSPGTVYTAVSRRVKVTDEALRAQGAPGEGRLGGFWADPAMQRYLQLPPTTTERLRNLAEAITAPHPTVYGKVRAIEAWLAENTAYDLDAPVPPPGADAVDHFVFFSRRGFCEQIASALVVMLRAVGVPARIAAGYTPGRWDPFAGVWVVRGADAHAWAEVWFPFTGWQGFDPTADVPLAGDSASRRSLGGPMVEAVASVIVRLLPVLLAAGALAAASYAVIVLARRRRERVVFPARGAQQRFQRLASGCGVEVSPADSNLTIAARVAAARPDVSDEAHGAASALDQAAFGAGPAEAADTAVEALAAALRGRVPATPAR